MGKIFGESTSSSILESFPEDVREIVKNAGTKMIEALFEFDTGNSNNKLNPSHRTFLVANTILYFMQVEAKMVKMHFSVKEATEHLKTIEGLLIKNVESFAEQILLEMSDAKGSA